MKKVTSYVVLFAMTLLLSVSCSKSDPVAASCNTTVAALSKTFSDAATAYAADPTSSAKCNAYKTAGTAFVNGIKGCPGYDQSQLTTLQSLIDSLVCP